ncbi:MAG: glycosyltransferase family 2 protein, partial [Lachnospiraceae bacterium]|nr:glycosyltransferase family 2 protein [Lachnospiraceae bacterium]
MAAEKDITVVVPVYNGAEMLSACVESVFCAGKRISEVLIVDDGSTDDTPKIAESLADKNPEIRVIHTDNHGCYTARITGLQAARTTYVTSVDVDDRYVPGALDLLAELLVKKDADVAIGAYREVSSFESVSLDDSGEVRVYSSEEMWPRIMKWKTQEFVNYVWNKLYKREVFSKLTEADGVNQGEDVLITCQAFCNVNKIAETT